MRGAAKTASLKLPAYPPPSQYDTILGILTATMLGRRRENPSSKQSHIRRLPKRKMREKKKKRRSQPIPS